MSSIGHEVDLVALWQGRIRRTLLVAHALPALFGLTAVAAGLGTRQSRVIDVGVWAVVLCWSVFLLVGGWRRAAEGISLSRWIIADALIMAGLMFIGTPARQVVHYIAIDGALYAAAFFSTSLGFMQLGIVFSGLVGAAVARHLGSDLPSPLVGWLLPVLVPAAGVLAFGHVRRGLARLSVAITQRDRLVERRHAISLATARYEATLAGVNSVDQRVAPFVDQLAELTARYAADAASTAAARDEIEWLQSAVARARADVRELLSLSDRGVADTLQEAVDTGVLGASALHVSMLQAACRVAEPDLLLKPHLSAAIAGFVREAVTNAAKYGAPPIEVAAERHPRGGLTVSVSDAGAGPGPDSGRTGLGTDALHDYAAAAGGRLHHHVHAGRYALQLTIDPLAAGS